MKKITEQTVKTTTDIIIKKLIEQQDKKEMNFKHQLHSINKVLLKLTQSSPTMKSTILTPSTPQPIRSLLAKCSIYDDTFNS